MDVGSVFLSFTAASVRIDAAVAVPQNATADDVESTIQANLGSVEQVSEALNLSLEPDAPPLIEQAVTTASIEEFVAALSHPSLPPLPPSPAVPAPLPDGTLRVETANELRAALNHSATTAVVLSSLGSPYLLDGVLQISRSIALRAEAIGDGLVTIGAQHRGRVFEITGGAVVLEGLELRNGRAVRRRCCFHHCALDCLLQLAHTPSDLSAPRALH